MNIDGLSEATLEKFIARGFIHDFGDILRLESIVMRSWRWTDSGRNPLRT